MDFYYLATPVPSTGATGQADQASLKLCRGTHDLLDLFLSFSVTCLPRHVPAAKLNGAKTGASAKMRRLDVTEKMPKVKYATLSFSKNLTGQAIAFDEENMYITFPLKAD